MSLYYLFYQARKFGRLQLSDTSDDSSNILVFQVCFNADEIFYSMEKVGISKIYGWHRFLVFIGLIYLFILFHRSLAEFHLEQIWLSFLALVYQVLEKRNVSTTSQVFTLNPYLDPQDPVSSWQLA